MFQSGDARLGDSAVAVQTSSDVRPRIGFRIDSVGGTASVIGTAMRRRVANSRLDRKDLLIEDGTSTGVGQEGGDVLIEDGTSTGVGQEGGEAVTVQV